MEIKECPKCGTKHTNKGKFCSRKCANSRVRTDEIKKKISKSINEHLKTKIKNTKNKVEKECIICKNLHNKHRKTCSNICRAKLISNKVKGKTGGYREGSGRAKTGYYKGIYCGSTYELIWVIYQIDNNIPFSRFEGCLTYNNKKYFPDFLQNGKIIEIKGYESKQSVDVKNEVANKNGYEVIVLRKEDLVKEFEWVNKNYTHEYYKLYDGYKPKYNYICSYCNKEFFKDNILKTTKSYCSRKCSGLGNIKRKYAPVV